MNVNVNIERLILDGISLGPGEGVLVKAAVEGELSRLLRSGSLASSLQSGGALTSVRAESIQVSAEGHPSRLGKQIARSVYGGIGERK